MKRVLIADDDAGMRTALEARFLRRGWHVDTAVDGSEALGKFRPGIHRLVITDVRMPGCDGFEVMRQVRESTAQTAVILLTAYACVPDAVEAMRGGACDYLVKPVSFEKLESVVEQVLLRAVQEPADNPNAGFRDKSAKQLPAPVDEPIIGSSPVWRQALQRARRAAAADADVLIEAESGTGKELVARLIHRLSARRAGPFVAVNCAALPETLLESELFGHARGAFTGAVKERPGRFEMARGGTLLLDEVGEMPLVLQPKLLRVLQERECARLGSNQSLPMDIRVIATTNRALEPAIAAGCFRPDLYYRLNVIPVSLPPLRERPEDIPELARYFAQRFSRQPLHLSEEMLACLSGKPWPGNVRELANFIRRAVALSTGGEIGMEAFSHESAQLRLPPPEWKPGLSLEEMEKGLFAMTLKATGGNRARAAELLGVSLRTVRNKVRQFGLPARTEYGRSDA